MKIIYCSLLLAVLSLAANAQTPPAKDSVIITDHAGLSNSTFIKVEKESVFPGGIHAWGRFLNDNLVYPKKAIKRNIQGTVTLQFIVEKDGTISDIEALDGPELLREAAVDVIKKCPNWIPAVQSGKNVKSYKKQPITFKLQNG